MCQSGLHKQSALANVIYIANKNKNTFTKFSFRFEKIPKLGINTTAWVRSVNGDMIQYSTRCPCAFYLMFIY